MTSAGPGGSSPASYTLTAILLHWLVALFIFGNFPLGLYMADLPRSPLKLQLYSYHKWLGMTVLALVIARLVWRKLHRPPPLVEHMPQWQRKAAQGTHHLLYALMLLISLSGWLRSSALGIPVVWFGVLQLPDLIGRNKELGDALKEVHEALNFTLLFLIGLHVGAALLHHFKSRDDTLRRMLPFLRSGS